MVDKTGPTDDDDLPGFGVTEEEKQQKTQNEGVIDVRRRMSINPA